MRLSPGQKMHVVEYEERIELIPDRDITELRDFLKFGQGKDKNCCCEVEPR